MAVLKARIQIKRLLHNPDLPLPAYQSEGAVAMDIHAAVDTSLLLEPGKTASIPSGFAIALPEGYEAQIRPRSGLAANHAISIVNAPGTIDSDFRGELKILLINLGEEPFEVTRGMRVAQMLISPVVRAEWDEVQELPATIRGDGGFGHSGT